MSSLKNKKSLVTIGIGILVCVVWIYFVYMPAKSKKDLLHSENNQLEKETHQKEMVLSNLAGIIDRVKNIEVELYQCVESIYPSDSIGHFIGTLKQKLRDYNVSDIDVTPELPDLLEKESVPMGETSLNLVEFEINGQGEYIQIGKLMEALESEPYYNKFISVDLTYSKTIDPKILFNLKFSAYLRG